MKINSIFNNNFYDMKPLPLWAFNVHIKTNGLLTPNEEDILNNAITKISVPEVAVETVNLAFAGYNTQHPSKVKNNGQSSLTFNENEDLDVYKTLYKLYSNIHNPKYGESIDEEYTNSEFKYFDVFITVSLLDLKHIQSSVNLDIGGFELHACYLSSLGGLSFDYSSSNANEITCTLEYQFIDHIPQESEEDPE